MTQGIFFFFFWQEENIPNMRVIRVGTRKSQVSAGTGWRKFVGRVCVHSIINLGGPRGLVPSSSGMKETRWLCVEFYAER